MDYYSYVEYLLKNWQPLNQQLKELKMLVEGFNALTEEDIIEELTFKKSQEEKVKESQISDKTPSIALVYKEAVEKQSLKSQRELRKVIEATEGELIRLERAMNALSIENRQILEALYFQGKSYKVVARALALSESTLNRYRKKAIEYMAGLFSMEHIFI